MLDNTFRNRMATSMHKRCKKVVELRVGFPTKYQYKS